MTQQTVPSDPQPEPQTVSGPFTPAQVAAMNGWQTSGLMHPFTCRNTHRKQGILVAAEDGWHCPRCDYVQTWAHVFQLSQEALDEGVERRAGIFQAEQQQ